MTRCGLSVGNRDQSIGEREVAGPLAGRRRRWVRRSLPRRHPRPGSVLAPNKLGGTGDSGLACNRVRPVLASKFKVSMTR